MSFLYLFLSMSLAQAPALVNWTSFYIKIELIQGFKMSLGS
jgi:hypothetical protein